MSYLENLKNKINDLFNNATDKKVVDALGETMKEFENCEKEEKKKQDEYKELLDSYKDVIVHSNYKPTGKETEGQNEQKTLEEIIKENSIKEGK